MSVVNRMLRDLEGNQATNSSLKMQAVPESTSLFAKKLFWLLFGFAFLSIVWFVYQHLYQPEVKTIVSEKITTQNPEETSTKQSIAHNNSLAQQSAAKENTTNKLVQQRPTEATSPVVSNPPMLDSRLSKPTVTKQEIKLAQAAIEKPTQKPLKSSISAIEKNKRISEPEKEIKTTAIKATAENNSQIKIKKQSLQTILKRQLEDIKQSYAGDGYLLTKQRLTLLLDKHSEFHPARIYLFKVAKQASEPNFDSWLAQAIQDFPRYSSYRLTAAHHYFAQSNFTGAEHLLLEIDRNFSNYFNLVQMRALARQKLAKHQLAILDYNEILKHTPNRGDIYLAIGISFDAIGNTTQAKRSFQNAMSDPRLSRLQLQFAENKINSYQG